MEDTSSLANLRKHDATYPAKLGSIISEEYSNNSAFFANEKLAEFHIEAPILENVSFQLFEKGMVLHESITGAHIIEYKHMSDVQLIISNEQKQSRSAWLVFHLESGLALHSLDFKLVCIQLNHLALKQKSIVVQL